MEKQISFKNRYTFVHRLNEANKCLEKYSDKIPVIVENKINGEKLPKNKYLVPIDLTIGQFIFVIRKNMELSSEKSLFLFFNETHMVPTSSTMGSVYELHKDKDNFLYCTVEKENTFGYIR